MMKRNKLLTGIVALCAACLLALAPAATAEENSAWISVGGTVARGSDEYGETFSGTAFRLRNDELKAWPDKFGMAYRINKDAASKLDIVVTADKDTWYADGEAAFFRLSLLPKADMLETEVKLYAGEKPVAAFSTVMLNWTDTYSYSTNYVYFGKAGEGWSVCINDEMTEIEGAENLAAMEETLEGFENRVGYLQLENGDSQAKLTFLSVRYGIPSQSIDPPEGWSNGKVLDPPDWTLTAGGEIVGWNSTYEKAYTLKGEGYPLPLNGLDLKLRMAHGRNSFNSFLMLCSDYDHTWYAGTFSVGVNFSWTPSMGDRSVKLQFMVYTNRTESEHEEPIKFSVQADNFKWFETNEFQIYKQRGVWGFYLNGSPLFADDVSAEGKTLDDYLVSVSPYFGDGGYLEMWANSVSNEAYVLESASSFAVNAPPAVNQTEYQKYNEQTFEAGEEIRIDLTKLFSDPDGDELVYFATKGTVKDGVWTYRSSMEEELYVTLRASDTSGTANAKLTLNFAGAASESGCGKGGSSAALAILPALAVGALRKRW